MSTIFARRRKGGRRRRKRGKENGRLVELSFGFYFKS